MAFASRPSSMSLPSQFHLTSVPLLSILHISSIFLLSFFYLSFTKAEIRSLDHGRDDRLQNKVRDRAFTQYRSNNLSAPFSKLPQLPAWGIE